MLLARLVQHASYVLLDIIGPPGLPVQILEVVISVEVIVSSVQMTKHAQSVVQLPIHLIINVTLVYKRLLIV